MIEIRWFDLVSSPDDLEREMTNLFLRLSSLMEIIRNLKKDGRI